MIQRRIHPDRRIRFLNNKVIKERRKLIRRKKERNKVNRQMLFSILGIIISLLILISISPTK